MIPCEMDPGPLFAVGRLKGADFGITLQRQRDFIEAVQESGATARIDLEAMYLSRRRRDALLFQNDADASHALAVLNFHGEPIDDLLVDHNGQDAVLEAVGEKDIAESRSDDGADAHFLERPHRALTRRSTTEIRTCDEDFRVPVRLAVQDKFGIFR